MPTERSNKLRNLIDFILKIEITIVQLKNAKAVNKSLEFLESGKTITANPTCHNYIELILKENKTNPKQIELLN